MAELETDFPHLNPDDPTKDIWRIPKEDLQGDRLQGSSTCSATRWA